MAELMNIYSEQGTKVRYIARNGYPSEVPNANKFLKEGEVYTVKWTDVGQSMTYVYLEEVPERGFNSVMFEEVG